MRTVTAASVVANDESIEGLSPTVIEALGELAGMLEAQGQFRKIIGYTDLAKLAVAVERDIASRRAADTPTTTAHTSIATAAPEVAATPA